MFPVKRFSKFVGSMKRVGLVCLGLAFAVPSYGAMPDPAFGPDEGQGRAAIDWSVAPWAAVQSGNEGIEPLVLAQAGADAGSEERRVLPDEIVEGRACNPFTPEFECDEETGEVIVTLVNSVGSFDADDIAIKVLTPGITLSWPDPTDPLRVRLEGALPGQVIVLETSAVQVGGGSEPGLDKCCMGKIRITVPRLPCHDDQPKLKISKTCRKLNDAAARAPNAECDITIHYSGPAPTAANPLRLNDVMSGGGNWKILSVLSPHIWSCDPLPHNGPAAFSCQLKSEDQVVPVGWLAFHSFLRLQMQVDEGFKNCATLRTQSPSGRISAKDCAKLEDDDPQLLVEKTGPEACVVGGECEFTITLRNEGEGAFDGSALMMDQMNLDEVRILDMTPMPMGCSAEMLGSSGFACIGSLRLDAGESKSFTVKTHIPAGSNAPVLRNCVGLYRDGHDFEGGSYNVDPRAGVDLPGDVLSILDDDKRLGYACASVRLTDLHDRQDEQPDPNPDPEPETPQVPPVPQGRPELQFKKTSLGDCLVNRQNRSYSCEFVLTSTNVGSASYVGPIVISEQLGQPNAQGLDVVAGDNWDCQLTGGRSASCVNPSARLAPGEQSSLTLRVQLPALERGGRYTNCARLGVGSGRRERVAVAQRAMLSLGIDIGDVDGLMGRLTRAGLRQLQQQLNMPVTGKISDELFERLGVGSASRNRRSCASVTLPPLPRPYQPPVQPDPPVYDDPRPLPLPLPTPVPPGLIDPLPQCDGVSAVPYKGRCVCRYRDMRKVSAGSCKCRRGLTFIPGQGCSRLVPPRPPVLQCDRATTIKKGNACVCRYRGMKQTSATSCACKRGRSFIPGKGCVSFTPPPPPALQCDRATTRKKGNACVCRYRGMKQTSATSCACKRGRILIPGRGCVSARPPGVKPPEQALRCNRATTIKKGNQCVCRYGNMRKLSANACGCKRGTKFVAGRGCLTVRKPGPAIDPSKPIKPRNPRLTGPRCDPRSTVTRGRQCVCRQGYTRVNSTRCVRIKKKPPQFKPPRVQQPPVTRNPKVTRPPATQRANPPVLRNPQIVIPNKTFTIRER